MDVTAKQPPRATAVAAVTTPVWKVYNYSQGQLLHASYIQICSLTQAIR